MNQPPEGFATKLVSGRHSTVILWKPDGSMASTIQVSKEIWLNVNGAGDGLGDGTYYPVFHLFNYLDPSKAHSPDSGCRTNPPVNRLPIYLLVWLRQNVLRERHCRAGSGFLLINWNRVRRSKSVNRRILITSVFFTLNLGYLMV